MTDDDRDVIKQLPLQTISALACKFLFRILVLKGIAFGKKRYGSSCFKQGAFTKGRASNYKASELIAVRSHLVIPRYHSAEIKKKKKTITRTYSSTQSAVDLCSCKKETIIT